MPTSIDYNRFLSFAETFSHAIPPVPVDGEYYDLPGTTVYNKHTQLLAGKNAGRLEVNVVTPEAATAFEWAIEITLNDKAAGEFIHLIVRPDGSIAETYGKTVLPVNATRADEILGLLRSRMS